MAKSYARLLYQYKFKYQTVISTRFDKEDDKNQMLDRNESYINSNISNSITETDSNNIDIKYSLEHQIQKQRQKRLWMAL